MNNLTSIQTSKKTISVVTSIYNGEKYLPEFLQNLKIQSLKDAEFILVDEGSTDGSLALIEEFARTDSRVRVVRHLKNRGLLAGVVTGISEAKGDFCAFIDPDDYYNGPDVLLELVTAARQLNTDIMQYDVNVTGGTYEQNLHFERWLSTDNVPARVEGTKAILNIFFSDDPQRTAWNVWTKVYKTSVLKNAIKELPSRHVFCAYDALFSFVVCLFAQTYAKASISSVLTYRINSGISTKRVTLDAYCRNYAVEPLVVEDIKRISERLNRLEAVRSNIEWLESCIWKWNLGRVRSLLPDEQSQAIAVLKASNNCLAFARGFVENVPIYDPLSIAAIPALRGGVTPRPVKTIGIFYHRYFEGGVERVISHHMPMFLKLGYKVVLITEKICPEREFSIPEGVERELIPDSYSEGRLDAWKRIIERHSIDTLIYHACCSYNIFHDAVLLKMLDVRLVTCMHEITATMSTWGDITGTYLRPLYQALADRSITLIRMEETFHRSIGTNAVYVPNPIEVSGKGRVTLPEVPHILWIGRLDENQKNFRAALEIFRRVLAVKPEIICDLVGPEFTHGSGEVVTNWIRENGLEGRVIWHGMQQDVGKFYENASVHLCTSRYETFSMMITESKSYGVPMVAFDMPYVDLLHEGGGVLLVPQGDINAATQAILQILGDDGLAVRLSREAEVSLKGWPNKDELSTIWQDIFQSLENFVPIPFTEEECRMRQFLQTALSLYTPPTSSFEDVISQCGYSNIIHMIKKRVPYSWRNRIALKIARIALRKINK